MSKIINVSFMITSDMISQGLLDESATCQAPISPQSQMTEKRLFTPFLFTDIYLFKKKMIMDAKAHDCWAESQLRPSHSAMDGWQAA